jgi:hypothetical protein
LGLPGISASKPRSYASTNLPQNRLPVKGWGKKQRDVLFGSGAADERFEAIGMRFASEDLAQG